MNFCTQCGERLQQGVEHVCSKAQEVRIAATAESTTTHSSGAQAVPQGPNWFALLWENLLLGIKAPDALAKKLHTSSDVLTSVVLYIIFGLTYGLFAVAMIHSTFTAMSGIFGSMGSAISGVFSAGGLGGGSYYNGFGYVPSFPWFTILIKGILLFALVSMAYSISFGLVSLLFKGKGTVKQYFIEFGGVTVPSSLVLLISAILVNLNIILGVIGLFVAFVYLMFFSFLQHKQTSQLNTAKTVYTLPLAHVLPILFFIILGLIGL